MVNNYSWEFMFVVCDFLRSSQNKWTKISQFQLQICLRIPKKGLQGLQTRDQNYTLPIFYDKEWYDIIMAISTVIKNVISWQILSLSAAYK